jgi:glycyl-tRNA synthetase beta chain
VQRIRKLAGSIARMLGADVALAERAAYLCKADLLTDMVGEFPELQGIMGMYYARHDGEPEPVACAIEAHYHPRHADDSCPSDLVSVSVALADKLDTLVGIYGIGLVPTGDKDPYGLRRQAVGISRILIEKELALNVFELLELARSQFSEEVKLSSAVAVDTLNFIRDRLRYYFRDKGFPANDVEAVVSQNVDPGVWRVDDFLPRLEAVKAFKELPEAQALAAANKRILNILKGTFDYTDERPNVALMAQPEESALLAAMDRLQPEVALKLKAGSYADALCMLAGISEEVHQFFERVLVMADDEKVRRNRLTLLQRLGRLMNQVADISKLAAGSGRDGA